MLFETASFDGSGNPSSSTTTGSLRRQCAEARRRRAGGHFLGRPLTAVPRCSRQRAMASRERSDVVAITGHDECRRASLECPSLAGVNGVGTPCCVPRLWTPRREIGYPSTAEADEATAPKIAAHSPTDNSKTTISDAPIFSGRAAARADRSDRDGPQVVLLLRRRAWRSAASACRRRFRKTGLAGVRPTAGR